MAFVLRAACSGRSDATGSTARAARVADHRGQTPLVPADRHIHAAVMPPIGGIEERPVAACPAEEELAAGLRERWQVPLDAAIEVVACVRGHFGRPGWLVAAFVEASGDQEFGQRIEVLATDGGGVIAAADPATLAPVDRGDLGGNRWQAVDLDGDGIDELLELQDWNQVAVRATSLAVFRIAGGEILRVASLDLAYDNKAAKGMTSRRIVQCTSQYTLADGPGGTRRILVEGTITTAGRQAGRIIGTSCPPPGAHTYRLVGGALEEVKP